MGASPSPANITDDAASASAVIIKAAKKELKRQESNSMKIKHLTKALLAKLESNESIPPCKTTVKKYIEESDMFVVNGKVVTLTKKSSSSSSRSSKKRKSIEMVEKQDTSEDSNGSTDKKAAKKAAKKAKKEKKKKSSSSSSSNNNTAADSSNSDIISAWRTTNKIVLKDARNDEEGAKITKSLSCNTTYYPYQTFDAPDCVNKINAKLIDQCTKVNGFVKPSPIQAQCWPVLLSSTSDDTDTDTTTINNNGSSRRYRDVVGIAETGSGKTLAFSMPALSIMSSSSKSNDKHQHGRSPRMLVLAPTRELAMQSQKVLEEFGKVVNLSSTVIYGGVPKHAQKDVLRKGVDCIVGTPGRLKDLINDGSCRLNQINHLVLDEADRMLVSIVLRCLLLSLFVCNASRLNVVIRFLSLYISLIGHGFRGRCTVHHISMSR